ncbi:MAG: sigma-70 family RNA polymerase sigma factor [Brevundimonas sp.]|nr:MAG: sigma-70 family RNA polymerase sigma factor [Brevundimonas sp.]
MYGSATTSSFRPVRAVRVTDGGHDFDQLIVAVAQTRDREAFARLFEHFAPRLKAWLIKGGAVDAAAEEFAQEAMLTVWRKAELFDSRMAHASTWIFTIARNRRLDALRKDARAPMLELGPPPLDPERPDDLLEERQDAVRIREAMAALTPEQAQVLHLSFFLDQPHSAIAERLCLPLGTVKSRIRKAMLKLRIILEQEGGR